MKKRDLLQIFDDELLDKLFGFCYARTNDSYEAEALCSDIVYALVKAAHGDGEIDNMYAFLWRVARNVYADYANHRRKYAEMVYAGDPEEILSGIAEDEYAEDTTELLTFVYRRMAFLTKAYRDVMIRFYIDGLSTAQIANEQGTSEVAVRQRLFSARQKIKSEVEKMADTNTKPVALDKINFVFCGTGDPHWGDPRHVCTRTLSKHIVWLCRKKPMRVFEIAEELNVPTLYVEEEVEILCRGENGVYGLLRRLDNGKYAINFILLDKDVFEKASALYVEKLPKICDIISKYVEEHKAEYLVFPYLNKRVDMNLILWQQVYEIADAFCFCVMWALEKNHFSALSEPDRPFSVYGYVDNGASFYSSWDGVVAQNVCGFSNVQVENITANRIHRHFDCGLNVSKEPKIQLALRAIDGLSIAALSESEKEHAAKAIECGYLYREGDMLYTKILVSALSDKDRLFAISRALHNGYFDADAESVAEQIAALIQEAVPEYLLGEWRFANTLAALPVRNAVVDCLIEKGVLTPPKDGIGAEGCWMSVENKMRVAGK